MKVVIASHNPVKVNATKLAFAKVFPNQPLEFIETSVDSGVSDQPTTNEETLLGALNRVEAAYQQHTSDFAVGIEGGVEKVLDLTQSFAWITIKSSRGVTKSKSASFTLPSTVIDQLNQGKELGDAMDTLHHLKNSKQKQGAVGILTDNLVTRTDLYIQPLIMALVPHKTKKSSESTL